MTIKTTIATQTRRAATKTSAMTWTGAATRTSAARRKSSAARTSVVMRTRVPTANTVNMKAIMFQTVKTKYGKEDSNIHFLRWLHKYQSESKQDEEKETPPDGDESAIKSPNVTSSSLPSMEVTAMDKDVQDAIQPARTIKVPAWMVQKSLDIAGYVRRSLAILKKFFICKLR